MPKVVNTEIKDIRTQEDNLRVSEDMIKRFKKAVNKSGILLDYRRHEAFYPKNLRRKLKSEENRRRRNK